MPPRSPLTDAADASWLQLEELVERLHAAARSEATPREFFHRLLAETFAAVGAVGGAAWRRSRPGQLELIAEYQTEAAGQSANISSRREAVQRALAAASQTDVAALPSVDGFETFVAPIADAASATTTLGAATGALELCFPAHDDPTVRQGRRELAATLAAIAADFQTLAELRERRATAGLQQHAVDFLRRIQQPRDLEGTAFAVANEARRLLQCDRVLLLLRRGDAWRLVCVSGVSRADRKSELARLSVRLAEDIANWGEPIAHAADRPDGVELPARLATALAEHLDHSHARQLAAAPFAFNVAADEESVAERRGQTHASRHDVVLIAESFDATADDARLRQLLELGELAAPALARAATLDQFPLRTMLAWSERFAALREPVRRRRALWIAGSVVAAVLALLFVPATLSVEAPATLAAAVEREIFASATGSIAEIHVAHGDHVKQGDVLIVLRDPELALKLQQVRGEIDATQQRLDALAVTRTDRTLRERETEDRLPLSAEQRQLEERLAGFKLQRELLEERRTALTLRSPIDGEILTADVETLLASRPVERGEALLTVADASTGWLLKAETPQRDVGEILAAQRAAANDDGVVTASVRLSGDVRHSYPAHLLSISSAAPIAAEGLEDAAPPIDVRLALDGEPPAEARPGMAAAVRIDCGRRSLGYVWLHDIWATMYRWLTF